MKKINLLFLVLMLSSSLFATNSGYKTRFDRAQVIKDVNAQNMDKYEHDNFQVITPQALADKGIISDANATINNVAISNTNDFLNHIDCSSIIDNSSWTATVYGIEAQNGIVQCMVSPIHDLNNPIGLFNISYPNAKKFFAKNIEAAKQAKAAEIDIAKTQFDGIYTTIKQKQDALRERFEGNQDYLTVPEVLTSVILTDTSKIDVSSTRDTGKLQFKNGVNVSPKSNVVINGAESIFNTYTGLGDVSMQFFVILLAFFGAYGLGKFFLTKATDGFEGKKNYDRHIPYMFGIVAGALLFIPTSSYNGNHNIISENGKDLAQYDVMDTQFQNFERDGYSLFSDWANHAASVVIDSEMQSIINKSGIGTASQIANAYAGKKMYSKLTQMTQTINQTCNSNYNIPEMYMSNDNTKFKYSDNSSTVFPTSNNYGYAMALYNTEPNYYRDLPTSDFYTTYVQNAFNNIHTTSGEVIGSYYYPKISLAACGKNYFKMINYKKKYQDYTKMLTQLEQIGSTDNGKLHAIQGLVEYQYQLFNDWGYLSVLGLPITKLETELLGGLYSNPENKVIDKLNQKMESNQGEKISHQVLSSIPYEFIPGINNIYKIVSKSIGDVGTLASGIPFVGGLFDGAAKITGGVVGLGVSYAAAKILIGVMPIIGIIILGLLRFILIITKIFGLHFAGLFILPVAFAKENLQMIGKFSMKLFATMLELPLFVLAIYLAVVLNGLIHGIGDYFGKQSIIAMIDNAEASNAIGHGYLTQVFSNLGSKLLLYMFDGFMEVAVAAIAIVMIYKIVVSFHNSILDTIEIQGLKGLDSVAENFKNDAAGWGSRI